MSKYPNIQSKQFYNKIYDIFSEYKIFKNTKTEKELCYPKKYKLQKPQEFVSKYISPKTPYNNILIFHQIGAGKTCASIRIAEEWIKFKKILVSVPASLIDNYKKEIKSRCTGHNYVTDEERQLLNKYRENSNKENNKKLANLTKIINNRINANYYIISHQKLISLIQNNNLNLNKYVLIIDEVQNVVSEYGKSYKLLYNFLLKTNKNVPIILLSATPMFDKPIELALTLNLLKLDKKIPVDNQFYDLFIKKTEDKSGEIHYDVTNLTLLKKYMKGFISYYHGAHPITYPKKKVFKIFCKMKELQYRSYCSVSGKEGSFLRADIFKMSDCFFISSRAISNIAYPNKKTGEDGYNSFRGKWLKGKYLRQCSEKFYQILKRIRKSDGLIFIYSNFKEYGGLKPFIKVLENNGYKNYQTNKSGRNRFAIWSGDQSFKYRDEIRNVFNDSNNKYGEKIKIFLGTPAIKEGITLLRIKDVHILEPYWNISRMNQIIGRAIRYCSHKDMIKSRKKVNVYLYYSVHPKYDETIDTYIYNLANRKQVIIDKFETALKECAVDCKLNRCANIFKKNKYRCDR